MNPFNYPNASKNSRTILTGIIKKNNYHITGIYESPSLTTSFIYKGDLKGNGQFYKLNYKNYVTNLFGPMINRKVVGTFIDGVRKGLLYDQGWTVLIVPSKQKVLDTVPHSTNGNLIFGNYKDQSGWKAFIYHICEKTYFKFSVKNAVDTFGYGVWKNKHNYTLCGSYMINGKEIGYIVNYNGQFSNMKSYIYNNDLTITNTHFNSISKIKNHYVLSGFYIKKDDPKQYGFVCKIGHETIWTPIDVNAKINDVTGIDKNVIIGFYTNDAINGYGYTKVIKI